MIVATVLDSDQLSLSLVRGMVASVNPCGFVLLPTYLLYFLGAGGGDASTAAGDRAGIRRALVVGGSVSAGFMAVFVVAGLVIDQISNWFLERAFYATAIVGAGLVVLGVAMLLGFRLPISTPSLSVAAERRTVRTMFFYGCAYAVASIGCTIGLFIPTMFGAGRRDGALAGITNGLAYGFGMGLVVVALTVSLAFARIGIVSWLRASMRYVERVAAVFVVASGLYLIYYFWFVDLRNGSGGLTSRVDRMSSRITARVDEHSTIVVVVLGAVVAIAVIVVAVRSGRSGTPPAGGGVVDTTVAGGAEPTTSTRT